MKDYKDFKDLEREIREEFAPLLTLREVRHILSCSVYVVVDLIKEGKLDAYHLNGTEIERAAIRYDTQGMRITPSSLRAHLESIKIK